MIIAQPTFSYPWTSADGPLEVTADDNVQQISFVMSEDTGDNATFLGTGKFKGKNATAVPITAGRGMLLTASPNSALAFTITVNQGSLYLIKQ